MQRKLDSPADSSRDFLGCGLSGRDIAAVLAASVAVFLLWNGPLWNVRAGSSHVGRIVLSYAIVVPLAALGLVMHARWTWMRLLTATALIWSAKLVLTATLYSYLTRGSSIPDDAVPVRDHSGGSPATAAEPYAPAAEPMQLVEVSGRVIERDAPIAGSVVYVITPAPGLPLGSPGRVQLTIQDSQYSSALLLAATNDRFVVDNRDAVLHTLRIRNDASAFRNVPLPGDGPREVPLPAVGVHSLTCANHASEQATLVVVDHPYAAVTDDEGRFTLPQLPAGAFLLEILRHGHAPVRRTMTAGAHLIEALTLDIAADSSAATISRGER